MSNPQQWLKVYNYSHIVAARLLPADPTAAADIASECFDIFMRLHSETGLSGDYRKWVGKTIGCLRKRLLKERARRLSAEDEEMFFTLSLRALPTQEAWCDAESVRKFAECLPAREAWAFEIIADGGTVKDLMDEMHIGPREALARLHQMRLRLLEHFEPERKAA
jgi:hypothetical protein